MAEASLDPAFLPIWRAVKNIDSNLFSSIYSAIFRCAGGRMLRLFSMFLQPMKVPPQFIEDYAFTSHTSTSLLKK
jgi:hypothetical protein